MCPAAKGKPHRTATLSFQALTSSAPVTPSPSAPRPLRAATSLTQRPHPPKSAPKDNGVRAKSVTGLNNNTKGLQTISVIQILLPAFKQD